MAVDWIECTDATLAQSSGIGGCFGVSIFAGVQVLLSAMDVPL